MAVTPTQVIAAINGNAEILLASWDSTAKKIINVGTVSQGAISAGDAKDRWNSGVVLGLYTHAVYLKNLGFDVENWDGYKAPLSTSSLPNINPKAPGLTTGGNGGSLDPMAVIILLGLGILAALAAAKGRR